ncbi:MAG: hypothetical protein V3V01_18100 [Acidimicrobiales bacterium]
MSIDFAHHSERNVAAILDYYDIEWQYEPTTFVLERYEDGSVSSAFSPDFYLPAFDLYVEITTMAQKHVTKKNRKLRQLRATYPEVNAKIFYQRDYERLMLTHLSLISGLAEAA